MAESAIRYLPTAARRTDIANQVQSQIFVVTFVVTFVLRFVVSVFPGTDPAKAQLVAIGTGMTGFMILDMAFNKATTGVVEGYAVGQRLDTGAPFVADLE